MSLSRVNFSLLLDKASKSIMTRVILISERTRLALEVAKEGGEEAVRRNYEKGVFDSDLLKPDGVYKVELAQVRRCIVSLGYSLVDCLRHEAQSFVFRDDDTVIILGDDGAFVNIAKLLKDQKVITIATTTKRCGRLMKFAVDVFEKSASRLLAEDSACIQVSISKAETSRGHMLEAVSDFFVGRADLRSSRYAVLLGVNAFSQISSGVIVSTGTGSTGWEKSACLLDDTYKEREPDDKMLTVVTRELCYGESLGTMRHVKSITFRSDDNDTRVLADGVLLDGAMLLLPAGTTVTITANSRAVRLCV